MVDFLRDIVAIYSPSGQETKSSPASAMRLRSWDSPTRSGWIRIGNLLVQHRHRAAPDRHRCAHRHGRRRQPKGMEARSVPREAGKQTSSGAAAPAIKRGPCPRWCMRRRSSTTWAWRAIIGHCSWLHRHGGGLRRIVLAVYREGRQDSPRMRHRHRFDQLQGAARPARQDGDRRHPLGRSCHGSMPEKGDNAVYKIARVIREIERLNKRLKRTRSWATARSR